jgi:Cof subfamily protein (haloacid dehalogenase superfamily)
MVYKQKMIVTDLDGTLLNSEGLISKNNFDTLWNLGKLGHLRVVATGRSLYSTKKIFKEDAPVDYIVCSTGACIVDWKSSEMLAAFNLSEKEVGHVQQLLDKMQLDYIIQEAAPDNHKCFYVQYSKHNPDLEKRNEIYKDFATKLDKSAFIPFKSCQFIVIIPGMDSLLHYEKIKEELKGLKVIRTTSPLDHETLWIEIYSKKVSKATGINYLVAKHGIDPQEILVVGNDYNDLDMLRISSNSYIVDNAPEDLKMEFPSLSSNNLDGFTEAVNIFLN